VFGRPSSPAEPVTPPPTSGARPARPAHRDVPVVWVRACTDCGAVDHLNAWGSPAVVDREPWSCRHCPTTAWVLRQLSTDL
jgi:hypothetical protein